MKFLIILFIWIIIDENVDLLETGRKCSKDLGVGYRSRQPGFTRLPGDNFKASSERPYCFARYGRLYHDVKRKVFGVWCPLDDDKSPWFQVDLGKMTTVRKITISSNVRVYQYVTNYSVSFGYKEGPWFLINDTSSGQAKSFKGMEDIYTPRTVDIGSYITARFFRIHPKGKWENYCLQLELHGCLPEKDCKVPIGVANSSIIRNYQLSASSEKQYHHASDARLNNKLQLPRQWGAWCASSNDRFPWLEVDMKIVREISGVSTRGHPFLSYDAWTTQYKVNYSKNFINWELYNKGELLRGNNDSSTIVTNFFKPTFLARFIKIIPTKWNDKGRMACLRVEIYECDSNNKATPSLIKGLSDQVIERGQSLTLECAFQGQPLIQIAWRKNGNFLSTEDDRINPIHIETKQNTTAIVDFERVTSADDAVFSCLAWYPGLAEIYERSGCVVTVLAPIPILNIVNVSNTFVVVNLTFIDPLTIDVRGFVIRVKHLELAPYDVFIPVIVGELNQTRYLLWELGSLRPYSQYVFHIAMFYVGNEVGEFTSRREAFTLQDVPYGAPMNFVVERLTPNSLGCVWFLPNITLRNGPITAFQVRFLKSVEEGEPEASQYVKLNQTKIILANLEAGAIYQVTVRAFTGIGPGPYVFPATLIFTGKSTAELNKINQMLITKKNAASVSMRLQNMTSDRGNLNKHDVELTIEILEKVVTVENTTDIGEYLINTVSNIMKANKTVLEESEMTNRTGTRYIQVLEKWLEGVDPKDKALQENSENVIVKKVYWHLGLLEEHIKFAEEEAEISIPTKILHNNKQNKSEDVSIYFVFYKNNKFFKNSTMLETKCVNGFTVTKHRTYTPVISGEVVGTDTQNLSEPVVLRFKMNSNATLEDSACVYWDFKGNNEKGKWSTEGCSVHSVTGNVIECHCNHLTNFAAMMDVYAHTSRVCGHHQEVISYITIFGCFLSLIGLFITFLTYFMFKSLHQELSAKVLVQLCVSLFIVVLTFIIGIQQVHRPKVCAAVAIVLHYFTLVSFLWMMIEAILMYYSFVKVWPPREGGDIYKSSVAAWGIPLIIVMTTYFSSSHSYGGEYYCHITGVPLYVTYLAPMGIVIVTNFALFICIMHGLSTRPDSNVDRSHLERALERCRRAFGIMILMGLTWSFGFGLASKARLEFSYLFAITNGLQGFAIFIFYCVAQKNARKAWKRFFTCDRRAKHERNTDSYSERLRLASAASTRTQTRVSSDASTINRLLKNNDQNNMAYTPLPLHELYPPTEFHHHVSTPPRSPRSPKIAPLQTINQDAVLEDDGSFLTAAEDEMLDMQLQGAAVFVDMPKPLKAKMDLKKYSSYRALSGPTSFDVFSLVKTPSAKSLHRDCHHRKSAEFINKKGEKNRAMNRSSMIESSSLSSQHKNKMRVAKSMEQVNKKENFADAANANNNISLLDIGSHRSSIIKQADSIPDCGASTDEKTLGTETDSDTVGPNYGFYPVNNVGTMKSDATTMTDQNELEANGLVQNPLYGFKGDNHRSPDDIMQWLHEGNDPSKSDTSDSDYSSTYYKTSRSSSMTDLHGPLRSSASECSRPATSKKKAREKEIIDSMVLTGTTKSNNSSSRPRRLSKRHSKRSSGSSSKSDESENKSDLSEAGYSASEEDLVDNALFENRTKSRRKKTRRRSTNLSKNSQYVTLDEPSSHVSFV